MDGLFAVGVIVSLPPLLVISEAFTGSDVGGMQTYTYIQLEGW
jgi:hypothetical protein